MKDNIYYALTIATVLYTHMAAVPNFDLISADPKIPIHVTTNGGPWQTLNEQHYRFPIEVPENNLLLMSLSAHDDKSTPTNLMFSPERALDIAKQINAKITKAPTFYVQATVVSEKVPGSSSTIKHVRLSPQINHGATNKTKSGLSLENNVTQEMIDAFIGASDNVNPNEQQPSEPLIITTSKHQHDTIQAEKILLQPESNELIDSPSEAKEQLKKPEPSANANPAYQDGPKAPTNTLQHTDTPQMVLATLQKITKEKKQADPRAQWIEICNYLTREQAKGLLKDHDDAYIYNQIIDHYQALKAKTKSSLKRSYAQIVDIIKKSYKTAYPKSLSKKSAAQ